MSEREHNPQWMIPDYEPKDYTEKKEFKAYVAAIREIIAAADHPLCIREIHTALGEAKRAEWTAYALGWIRDIEAIGILPTRYKLRYSAKRPVQPAVLAFDKVFPHRPIELNEGVPQ